MNRIESKKFLSASFILPAVAFVGALVGLIAVLISNAVPGFSIGGIVWVVLELVGALVCVAAAIALSLLFEDKQIFVFVLNLAALALLMLAFGGVIVQRAILASAQFTYDKENALGWSALIPSFVTIGTCLVSAVLLTVNAFLSEKKR